MLGVLPAGAMAAAPTAQTLSVTLFAHGAQLNGEGTTGGEDTQYNFQYALGNDTFCASGGGAGTPSTTPIQQALAADSTFMASSTLDALSSTSAYCYRLVASNGSGTAYGTLVTFTLPIPYAEMAVTTTGATTATASLTLSTGAETGSAEIGYDVAGSPFCAGDGAGTPAQTTSPVSLPALASSQYLSVPIVGLVPGETYCALVTLSIPDGDWTAFGGRFTAGVPHVEAGETTAIGTTAARVTAQVDPVGQTTSYHVAYAAAGSLWCRSDGTSGAPSHSTKPLTLPVTDAAYHGVHGSVSGLSPATSYCLTVVADNATGSATSAPTPLPAKPRLTVSPYLDLALPPSSVTGLVVSIPAGISCPRRCTAAFPRGTQVTLNAMPSNGAAFGTWNPCNGGSCGYGGYPCITASSSQCTFVLSSDQQQDAKFFSACTLTATSHTITGGELSLVSTCPGNEKWPITMTGTITEIPRNGHERTYALARQRMEVTGTTDIRIAVPHPALIALRRGAGETATVTLTYRRGFTGQATATINHLTVPRP
jgi:hypothetical protein